jgi:meso-butanediol dehydrogenase/(S,S)-butanediol dehydrogenase/diacetyl reductase
MAAKVIVITGASGGLGRALATRFAQDGEKLVLLGRSLAKAQAVAAAVGGDTLALHCDVGSPDSVRAAFAQIERQRGCIDVLINNAATFRPFLIEEATDAQIMECILANLAGPIFCARSAIPMVRRGGLIINVSSESVSVPFPHLVVYQATKAALERLSLGLHLELEERGIRVAMIRPGQMTGAESPSGMDPTSAARFLEAALQRGLNPVERGSTDYQSATGLFRHVIDAPPDMHLDLVSYQGRSHLAAAATVPAAVDELGDALCWVDLRLGETDLCLGESFEG